MRKTASYDGELPRLGFSDKDLATSLGVGLDTAREISRRANARIKVGKRIINNAKMIQEYLDSVSGGE